MSTLLPVLISWLQEYGYPALWLAIFCAAICLPLPIGFLLLCAGAFAALGDFNILVLVLIAISASVAGDNVGYYLGRCFGSKVFGWLEHQHRLRFMKAGTITHSRLYFQKRGGWAILLSRFLFSALGSPINLLAGAELYPYRRFLFYDFIGESIGVLIPLTLGYVYGTTWEEVGDIWGTISLSIIGFLLTIYLAIHLIRLSKRTYHIKAVREARKRVRGVREARVTILRGGFDLGKERPDTLPL